MSSVCTHTQRCMYAFSDLFVFEPGHSVSYKIARAVSEDSNQPPHPRSLSRYIAGRSVATKHPKRHLAHTKTHYETTPTKIY